MNANIKEYVPIFALHRSQRPSLSDNAVFAAVFGFAFPPSSSYHHPFSKRCHRRPRTFHRHVQVLACRVRLIRCLPKSSARGDNSGKASIVEPAPHFPHSLIYPFWKFAKGGDCAYLMRPKFRIHIPVRCDKVKNFRLHDCIRLQGECFVKLLFSNIFLVKLKCCSRYLALYTWLSTLCHLQWWLFTFSLPFLSTFQNLRCFRELKILAQYYWPFVILTGLSCSHNQTS